MGDSEHSTSSSSVSSEDAAHHGERNPGGLLIKVLDSMRMSTETEKMKDDDIIRAAQSGPLGSYHRGVAVRMLTDYLSDLEELNKETMKSSVGTMQNSKIVLERLEAYRTALKSLQDANDLEPNSSLTAQERVIVRRMLQDYSRALDDRLEAMDEPEEGLQDVEAEVEKEMEEVQKFVDNLDHTIDDMLRSPRWGEPNNVGNVKDENGKTLEFQASFPILINMVGTALQGCEAKVQEFLHLQSQVRVYRLQCTHLVEIVSPNAESRFRQYRDTLGSIQKLDVHEVPISTRQGCFKISAFCIQSLAELERVFLCVRDLLYACAKEDWWRTALKMSIVLPQPKIPRWTPFAHMLRQCEWSMDMVELAFHRMKKLLTVDLASIMDDVVPSWSEDKRRVVLEFHGEVKNPQERTQELGALETDVSATLNSQEVAKELERRDLETLIDDLNELVERKGVRNFISKFDAGPPKPLATFLIQKLTGPTPMASYLPYTFRIDHTALVYKKYIDKGSSGMVAKYKWLGENVAVKTVKARGLSRARFEEEAAILATVQHPNVVQLHGCAFKEKDETGMLVMELMEEDLRALIDSRCPDRGPNSRPPFAPDVAIDLMLQIAGVMLYLRENRILHRDLKAKNVLISRSKRLGKSLTGDSKSLVQFSQFSYFLSVEDFYIVKLADFGLAKNRTQHTMSYLDGRAGTTAWTAPEVFQVPNVLLAGKYKWPADVYSFAMTCYEILTGREPFEDIPVARIPEKVLAGERPTLEVGSAVPELIQLIGKCWDSNPDNRPEFAEICKKLWDCKLETTLQVYMSPQSFKYKIVGP